MNPALLFLAIALIALPSDARIKRDHRAVAEFKRSNPCPTTGKPEKRCKGFVVDHVKPLACGGVDRPENMQYQSIADAKAKDKWERKDCKK